MIIILDCDPFPDPWLTSQARSAATHEQTDQKKNQKHDEQDPRDLGSCAGNAGESENGRDQPDHQKSYRPIEHDASLLPLGLG